VLPDGGGHLQGHQIIHHCGDTAIGVASFFYFIFCPLFYKNIS